MTKKRESVCRWHEDDDGNWETDCDEKFIIIEGHTIREPDAVLLLLRAQS